MAHFDRFLFLLLLAVMFFLASGIASDPTVAEDLYKKDAGMDARGVDKLPEMAKFLFARAETVTVTETVCSTHSPGKVTETSVVVTPAPGTVPHSTAPSETTNTAGATGVGLPTTLVTATLPTPLVTTTGPTAKPVVTSETKTGMTTGPAPVSTSITHAGNTTQTAAPTHTSGMSTTGGAATGASGTETTSATSQTNSAPVKAAGSNPVRALAVGLLLFAAL